jgi:hypothetical protein
MLEQNPGPRPCVRTCLETYSDIERVVEQYVQSQVLLVRFEIASTISSTRIDLSQMQDDLALYRAIVRGFVMEREKVRARLLRSLYPVRRVCFVDVKKDSLESSRWKPIFDLKDLGRLSPGYSNTAYGLQRTFEDLLLSYPELPDSLTAQELDRIARSSILQSAKILVQKSKKGGLSTAFWALSLEDGFRVTSLRTVLLFLVFVGLVIPGAILLWWNVIMPYLESYSKVLAQYTGYCAIALLMLYFY